MRITVTTPEDHYLFVLDISEDIKLNNFKELCEFETGIPSQQFELTHNGELMNHDFQSLKTMGVQDGDVIMVHRYVDRFSEANRAYDDNSPSRSNSVATGSGQAGGNSYSDAVRQQQLQDAEYLKNLFLSNPEQLALLKQNNPRLADALFSDSIDDFTNIMIEQIEERNRRDKQIWKMKSNPTDVEAQKLIEEDIRRKNIEANMEAAMEYNPENFEIVTMLYINCKVNGYPVKAFIDSGAQTTIMSSACANACNIMRLVDSRWAGIAKGVGEQKIIGRIHMVQLTIENDFLATSFSVLENQPMCMILGLDLLKRHQCCIDLKKNVLRIGTTGTETPFLPDNKIPVFGQQPSSSSVQ